MVLPPTLISGRAQSSLSLLLYQRRDGDHLAKGIRILAFFRLVDHSQNSNLLLFQILFVFTVVNIHVLEKIKLQPSHFPH